MRDAYYEALRRQGRNDLVEMIARCMQQASELSFGSFSPSSQDQHIQVKKLAETVRRALGEHHFNQ